MDLNRPLSPLTVAANAMVEAAQRESQSLSGQKRRREDEDGVDKHSNDGVAEAVASKRPSSKHAPTTTAHPGNEIKRKKITPEDGITQMLKFMKELVNNGHCVSKKKGKRLKCLCIATHFGPNPSYEKLLPFAKYAYDFCTLPMSQKFSLIMNWVLYSTAFVPRNLDGSPIMKIAYVLPQKCETATELPTPVRVCQHALMHVLDVTPYQWDKGKKFGVVGNLFPPDHGNIGQPSSNALENHHKEKLHRFFSHLETQAIDNILPKDFSKRNLYARYCSEICGWELIISCNVSQYTHIRTGETATKLPEDIVSWCTFHKFWDEFYSHLKTSNTKHCHTQRRIKRK